MNTTEHDFLLKAYEVLSDHTQYVEGLLLSVGTLVLGGWAYFYSSVEPWKKDADPVYWRTRHIFLAAFTAVMCFAYSNLYIMMTAHDRIMLRLEKTLQPGGSHAYRDYFEILGNYKYVLYAATAVAIPVLGIITLGLLAHRVWTSKPSGKIERELKRTRAALVSLCGVCAVIIAAGIVLCFLFIQTLWEEIGG